MRDDVERAMKKYKIKSFTPSGKAAELVQQNLTNNEMVTYIAGTNVKIKNGTSWIKKTLPGVVCLTDKRILFCSKTLGLSHVESINISDIQSVNFNRSLTGGNIELNTLVKTYDFLTPSKKETFENVKAAFLEILDQSKNKDTTGGNILNQIEKLADLKLNGVLTQEEFERKKAELLERL